jgi:hypothetical protein
MTSITRIAPTKMLAATLGAGVVLTMGALTIAVSNTEAHATSPTDGSVSATTAATSAPSAPAVPIAVPKVTAKKFAGKDWNGQ